LGLEIVPKVGRNCFTALLLDERDDCRKNSRLAWWPRSSGITEQFSDNRSLGIGWAKMAGQRTYVARSKEGGNSEGKS